jgi:hypothetical protein
VEPRKRGGDLSVRIVLGLGDFVMHLLDDVHRSREAAQRIDPPDARECQHRACIRDDHGDIGGPACHLCSLCGVSAAQAAAFFEIVEGYGN